MISFADLKRFEIFKDLNESEAGIIQEKASFQEYDEGKRIFAENSLATNLYLLLEGKVDIKMSSTTKKEIITVDTVKPNEIFGWSAITDPFTFTAAAWTAEKCKIIAISGEALGNLFKINNQLGYKVSKKIATVISRRLRRLHLRLADYMAEN